ncbi:hypothetical protein GLYMA_01G197650v4 [Glycine max]|nr:hypothetical protein GLYMA_01G197650v4 [Glycine max]KAH1163965.1 hypothetical protein GYH30_002144 [Glycine max]
MFLFIHFFGFRRLLIICLKIASDYNLERDT